MSDNDTSTTSDETTETGSSQSEDQQPEDLPVNHPLVKKLAIQKDEIKDLKVKAKRLADLEEAQKTDAEKAADRIANAESAAASVPAKVSEALKAHLVELHGIDSEDAELFLTAGEPDLLIKQVTRLLFQSDTKRRTKNNSVPREGNNPTAATDVMNEFRHQLFDGK